ncbi:MAG: beta-galactosidase [Nitratireductor sp.]
MKASLGICYYPEHWPEELWADDARRMAELGIRHVRIGEFAWSRIEPSRGRFRFDWLDRAIDTLHAAGLEVVLGTPTATPPKWLVDEMPDMLPVDREGRTRGFGSRRHYCFSHPGYRIECRRIVGELARRYGTHPAVTAWQTDNEFDCHATTLSWSSAARTAFREWLAQRYQSPEALNRAWGNVFWSMEIADFSEIELPNLTVTEANPAHHMDFRRFSSEQVESFNRLQVDIIRAHSPGRDVIHNFMGRTLAFDHFDVGASLDISSWDSYPLGFLEDRSDQGDEWKRRYMRAGDPDFQALHHDIYRATSGGRWWVMEQQPGPVNWAPHNPAPRGGMVRLWTLEAFAHGAETVSYFRWRQAPFAQEQMHAGLLRPDNQEAEGFNEVETVAEEIGALELDETGRASVAIVFDYPSAWAWEIQPQGKEFDYFRLVLDFYRALRRKGLSVDIVPASAPDIANRKLVAIPGLFCWNENLVTALRGFDGEVLVGPRSGSKTAEFVIPADLPPGLPVELLDAKVGRVESLRPDMPVPVSGGGNFRFWREMVETASSSCTKQLETDDGKPALLRQNRLNYLAGWPDEYLLDRVLADIMARAGLPALDLPPGLRIRQRGRHLFAVNYDDMPHLLSGHGITGSFILGSDLLEPSGVAVLENFQI